MAKMETVTLNADDVDQLLDALIGPAHYIRELQCTMNIPGGNALSRIIDEWNSAIIAHRKATHE